MLPLQPNSSRSKNYEQRLEYFKAPARELIARSPLEQILLAKPDIELWLEAQHGFPPKQSYVNTCIALSFMVELWQQAPSFGALSALGDAIYTQLASKSDLFQSSHIAQQPAWPGGLRYADCINETIDEARARLEQARLKIQTAYAQDRLPSLSQWQSIHKELSRAFETLLSLAWLSDDPLTTTEFTINTERIPRLPWVGQCALRLLCYPIERLCALHPPRPYKDRFSRGYVSYTGCQKTLNPWIYLTAPDDAHTEIALFNQQSTSADFLIMLWKRLRQIQGARLEGGGHSYYLWADAGSDTHAFQLYDPWDGQIHTLDIAQLGQRFKKGQWATFLG